MSAFDTRPLTDLPSSASDCATIGTGKLRSERTQISALQVVLKVAERCNINCTYCYYFNGGDEEALSKPAIIAKDTIDQVASYLAQGVKDLEIPTLYVSFHGGEPLMMKPELFDYACTAIREKIGTTAKVGFIVQTNGTIWNERFAEVFRKHQISVGVSLDGGKKENDRYRLDHRGKSTYDRIAVKIDAMKRSGFGAEKRPLSCISVLDSQNDYATVYTELRAMGFQALNFLLPDRSHDSKLANEDPPEAYGRVLSDIAKLYFEEDDESISVRQLDAVLHFFQKLKPVTESSSKEEKAERERVDYEIMVIHSDGTVALNDSYMPALAWWKATPQLHVADSTVRDYVDLSIRDQLNRQLAILPGPCMQCEWRGICRGGDAENRFSVDSGFDNPSIYCSALKQFYAEIMRKLEEGGYPEDELRNVLASAASAADMRSASMREVS
jgi:uncharacterized protein